MDRENDLLLDHLSPIEPPAGLAEAVLGRIDRVKRRRFMLRRLSFAGISLIPLVAVFVAFAVLIRDIRQSGFVQYFSLLFSDGRLIAAFWREYLFSLVESLPLLSVAGCLLSIFSFLVVIKLAAGYLNNGPRGIARPV